MRMLLSIAAVLVLVFASELSSVGPQSSEARPVAAGPARPAASVAAVIGAYCAGCHNGVMRSPAGALLDQFHADRISESPGVWARAYRQLQAGTMPPVGAPRPARPVYDAVLRSIEAALGADAPIQTIGTSMQIGTRLALLLWNESPDAALLEDARAGRLLDPHTLARQTRRMLGDPRAGALVSRFFFPWLALDRLDNAEPDRAHFPDYDVSLRDAMAAETRLFLLSQLREDRDPIELWSANYTFVNEQLAKHYGIPGVTGPQFRRVVHVGMERAGLLGQGSVQMATSRHNGGADSMHTSPASRAVWVRFRFFGAPPPQPFPGAQPVKPELPVTPQTRTLPAQPCEACHRNFFPLGYALESFDPIGRWRTRDLAGPVDASGAFVDGTPTNGVIELRNVLLQRPDAFRTTVTEQLLLYASGKPVGPSRTSPETLVRARRILHGAGAPRWSSIIGAIVRSTAHASE